jgi:hypothetical protein
VRPRKSLATEEAHQPPVEREGYSDCGLPVKSELMLNKRAQHAILKATNFMKTAIEKVNKKRCSDVRPITVIRRSL